MYFRPYSGMAWAVALHEEFDVEFERLAPDVQDELLAHAKLLVQFGPTWDGLGWIRSKDRATST
jgi:hypothetical protein